MKKDRAIAYTALAALIVLYILSALLTMVTGVMLFPFWLLGDRAIYEDLSFGTWE